jgi:transcriptional regulator with XRE-family HTH domain
MKPREIRKLKGLTAKFVADKLGIKTSTFNRKERANSFTTLQLAVLCELYGVELKDLDI